MSRKITNYNNQGFDFPSILGRTVLDDVFGSIFIDFPQHLKNSTSGYPVADIYKDEGGSTVLEFALAGFSREELSVDIQADKKSIIVSANSDSSETDNRRIAKRSFRKTYVNYDNNLDLSKTVADYKNGLLTIRVPRKEEVKPLNVTIN